MEELCGNCRFWDAYEESGSDGLCRFNPPIPMREDITQGGYKVVNWYWAETNSNDWCGKWEAKK